VHLDWKKIIWPFYWPIKDRNRMKRRMDRIWDEALKMGHMLICHFTFFCQKLIKMLFKILKQLF
jgi:hypothetical protein